MNATKKCPYPGLRPFTQDEAIFFKGRDRHVTTIMEQLEEQKFIMISGASGDGKSSVVFAGVIPQIKAGFLQAKYNNWKTLIIRPEGRPLENLIEGLASALSFDPEHVRKEVSYGFSSMIHLYKESKLYIDDKSAEWKGLDVDGRLAAKAESANFLFVMDQFEEFFTHSENMVGGLPSEESLLVMNLIIEAARVAKENDIPFYIVCTMRSDFLVNCASFRSLPELIGQSHYFIPRLNRSELFDVITGPAELNGDAISKRLTEYLINQTREGTDQLPILQHCLSRIWHTAQGDEGEMDLIHLAYVGGIEGKELPQDSRDQYLEWHEEQPAHYKKLLVDGRLENVINTHAEFLFEKVTGDLLVKHPESNPKAVKKYLAGFFKTIIKLSDGRTVRNRTTIKKIEESRPELPLDALIMVANEFRDEGNSLLSPGPHEVSKLDRRDTIDITHEALIRNWKRLTDWAIEDGSSFNTFLEFRKQSERWLKNDRHKDFLLPAGPLSYYSEWIETDGIGYLWLMKYFNEYDEIAAKRELEQSREYIEESRKELAAKRKARRRRYAFVTIASVIAIVALSGLSLWAMSQRSEAEEQKEQAELQRQAAEEARGLAEEQRQEALEAKNDAEEAKLFAEEQEDLAQRKAEEAEMASLEAAQQRQYAIGERNKALEASDLAKQKAEEAEQEKQRAILSEKELYSLSTKTLKEKLLLEISQDEVSDPLLPQKALLTTQLVKETNGDLKADKLYIGYLNALTQLNGEAKYEAALPATALRFINLNGEVFLCDRSGGVFKIDETGTSTAINSVAKLNNSKKLIDLPFFISGDYLARTTVTGEILLDNLAKSTNRVYKLKAGNFCTDFDSWMDLLAIATSDGELRLLSESTLQLKQLVPLDDPVISVKIIDENAVVYLTVSGDLQYYDLNTHQVLWSRKIQDKITTSALSRSPTELIVGTTSGNIFRVDISKETAEAKLLTSADYPITHLSLGEKDHLYYATSNSKIHLFDLTSEQDIIIRPSTKKIREMACYDDKLYIGYEPSELRIIPVNMNRMHQEICDLTKNDFSTEEWNEVVGQNIPKKSILCD